MTEWQAALGDMLKREGYGPEAGQTDEIVQWGFAVTEDLMISCVSVDGLPFACAFTADELSDYGEDWETRVLAKLEQARLAHAD